MDLRLFLVIDVVFLPPLHIPSFEDICLELCVWNYVNWDVENLMFFLLLSDVAFLGTQTTTCISRNRPPGLYFHPTLYTDLFKMGPDQKGGKEGRFWYFQVWAGWLVLVTASLLLPIYLAASLLAARHCTPQHSIVLPIGHSLFQFRQFHCCGWQTLPQISFWREVLNWFR